MIEREARFEFQNFFIRYGTIFALFLITVFFSLTAKGFVEIANILNILRQISLLTIISEGFTMCLLIGEIDLSFAQIASLASVISADLMLKGWNPLISVLLSLSVGPLIGLGNGVLVTKVGIPALITTLSTGMITGGTVYMYTKGISLYGNMPISFLNIGRGNIGPLPILVLIMLLFVSLFQIVVNKTKFGKYMRATGENPTAAWLAGINIESYKRLGFILSGLGAAITGVLLTARLGAASPEGASGFLMDGFATALLGQTVFGIGKPTPFGTFIGALIVGTLNNGMTLLGAPYYIQDITKGIIIILSVSATSLQKKKIERR